MTVSPARELPVLTVRQPWAAAIMHSVLDPRSGEVLGAKNVENRSRNLAGAYRGPLAIHAAKSFEPLGFKVLGNSATDRWQTWADPDWFVLGAIVGVVDLVDVHHSGMECSRGVTCHEYSLCSPWAHAYSHHLVLENPRPLAEPIERRGALGLRRLDEATTAAVWSQIGAQQ